MEGANVNEIGLETTVVATVRYRALLYKVDLLLLPRVSDTIQSAQRVLFRYAIGS